MRKGPVDKRLRAQYLERELRSLVKDELKPGDLLPPQAELCQRFDVGVGTIVSAMKGLEQNGLVVRQHGRGTFVTDPEAPLVVLVAAPGGDEISKLLAQTAADGRIRYERHGYGKRLPPADEWKQKGVKGVVTFGVTQTDHLQPLVDLGIRVICTDWITPVPGIDIVGVDSFRAGELAAETLIAAGHKRIGYVGFQVWNEDEAYYMEERDSELRLAGIRSALLHHRIDPDPSLFLRLRMPSPFQRRSGYFTPADAYQKLFKDTEPPTALIYFDIRHTAAHMWPVLAGAGLVIPDDLSVIGFAPHGSQSTYTTVHCHIESIVRSGIELLLSRLNMPHPEESYRILVEPTLQDHGSVRTVRPVSSEQ